MVSSMPFSIANRDELPIRGTVSFPEGAGPFPLVVIAHGFKGFSEWGFFPYLAERLAEADLAALRFDFARNGTGENRTEFDRLDLFRENSITREIQDLEDLVAALPKLPGAGRTAPRRIGSLGHSRGGAVAVLAAARGLPVRSLVTWSAVADFHRSYDEASLAEWARTGMAEVLNSRTGQAMPLGMELYRDLTERRDEIDVLAAERSLKLAHLIVHGTKDESVPMEDAVALQASAGDRAKLLLIPGAGHTFGAVHPFEGPTEELDQAVSETIAHFERTL